MRKKNREMRLFLLVFLLSPYSFGLPTMKESKNETEIGFKTEVVENPLDAEISQNSSVITENPKEVAGNEVEVIEGDYSGNETRPRVARHGHGGGGHHGGGGGHHYGGGGYHHHHHSYYGGGGHSYGYNSYGGGYYGGYGGYGGYGYGYGNGYYGYGNTYYGAGQGLVNLCYGWLWGCTISNYG